MSANRLQTRPSRLTIGRLWPYGFLSTVAAWLCGLHRYTYAFVSSAPFRHVTGPWRGLRKPASHADSSRLIVAARVERAQVQDWRDVRAKLVEQSREPAFWEDVLGMARTVPALEESVDEGIAPVVEERSRGWIHGSSVLEKGALLLSNPSDTFAIAGPYFHKAVILLLETDAHGATGVILNRPMGGELSFLEADDLAWNVWFGGPVDVDFYRCFHIHEDLAFASERIFRGLYAIDPDRARSLVQDGLAETTDFFMVRGHCGWAPQQLEYELEFETWTLAAADVSALLGDFPVRAGALQRVRGKGGAESTSHHGTGVSMWRRLYRRLGASAASRLGEAQHADKVLRLWTEQRLGMGAAQFPSGRLRGLSRANGTDELRIPAIVDIKLSSDAQLATSMLKSIWPAGTILVASASSFILEVPEVEDDLDEMLYANQLQYLHKGVLALVEAADPASVQVSAVLLNGPSVHLAGQEPEDSLSARFGGEHHTDVQLNAFGQSFVGHLVIDEQLLSILLKQNALRRVANVTVDDVLAVPREQRWKAAGGIVEDEDLAAIGDEQRRMWYESVTRQLDADGMCAIFDDVD
mmetsp:Transcript_52103/g.96465  ORF Transcript_52103/g.96465 Transcript_52103/m.96465 type:complete len:582 (-) Transcript_52103:71-1816(-)